MSVIFYYENQNEQFCINHNLAIKQNISFSEALNIAELQILRSKLVNTLKNVKTVTELNKPLLAIIGKQLTQLEFHLQYLWGFDLNLSYHRFWELPQCSCPKMDNRDSFPNYSFISGGCPLHQHLMP